MRPDDATVLKAFDSAPEVIRESLTNGLAIEFMAKMPSRYGIHIDTAGLVTEFIRDMLLGLVRPEAFIGKLTSVGIEASLARQITGDLNKEVFVPLRDKVRGNGERMMTEQHIPVMRVGEVVHPVTETPQTRVANPSEVTPSYNLIQKPVLVEKQIPPPSSFPPSKSEDRVPTMRTMKHDMDLVQHGSAPAPYEVTNAQLHPTQATPARMFQTASVPVTAIPAEQPLVQEMIHVIPDSLKTPRQAQPAATKVSSGDPYREPI